MKNLVLRSSRGIIFLGIFLSIIFNSFLLYAKPASLMLTPVRVILSGKKRAVSVHVNNMSTDSVRFIASLVTLRKDKNGNFYKPDVESKEEAMIKQMIRFSPKRGIIEGKGRQIVKMMVRKPKDLPPGEYMTFLQLSTDQLTETFANSVSGDIELDIVVQSSFPVIIQHGKVNAEITPVSLLSVRPTDGALRPVVNATFSRQGDYSWFGDVTFYYVSTKGKRKRIGYLPSIAIYKDVPSKSFQVVLDNISLEELHSGTIEVEYKKSTGAGQFVRHERREPSFIKEFSLPL